MPLLPMRAMMAGVAALATEVALASSSLTTATWIFDKSLALG